MANLAFDVQLDTSELDRVAKRITKDDKKNFRKAIGTSLSRTRRGVRALTSQVIRERYNVQAKRVKDGTHLTPVDRANWQFKLVGRNKPINLIHFRGKGGPPRWIRRGVSVAVQLGDRKVIRRAFIRTDIHGNPRVFTRFDGGQKLPAREMRAGYHTGKVRTGIRALKGPSIADMFFEVEIDEKVADFAQERFAQELDRNLRFFLGR